LATCCGNSYVAGDVRVAGRAEGSTPLSKRSLCDKPNGRLYLLGVNERLFAFRGERNDSFTVMSVRRDELPNVDDIRCLADVNLPLQYVIKEVRVSRGPDTLIGAPNDFEVVIEYENRIGGGLIGSFEDIAAYQDWADPLVQEIRSEWPAETIRIGFFERLPIQDDDAE
jgi:hypothetical protein